MHGSRDLEPLFPDRSSDEPVGRQFARRLRQAIESGLYKPSSRLLPRRELASRLGLARNTVTSAIEQLIAEGYLESRVGSGTFVVANVVRPALEVDDAPRVLPASARRLELARDVLRSPAMGHGVLRAGVPDVTEFPYAAWSRIARRKLAGLSEYLVYKDLYNEAKGEPALCAAIAQHVQQFRGISTGPERVIVVEGTQAAVRLAADVLLADGDGALVEDPCYPFIRIAFHAKNLRLHPLPVDIDGMDVTGAPPARLAYVAPSHQYPLGVRMSLERRGALLQWARANDAYILEDDYDSEFAFDGKPLPTLQSIDRDERVIYIGTFSKTLATALRLAYLIVPAHLASTFAIARLVSSLGGMRYVQATLADFLAEGHFVRHVRRMTQVYEERRKALVHLLEDGLPNRGFSIGGTNAGLHLTILAPPGFDDVAVAAELANEGVYVQALSAFCIERTDCRGFVVGYSAGPLDAVLDATRRVLRAIARRAPAS
jgi:GntR family transcriptional regulator/MocR family aminotransferase